MYLRQDSHFWHCKMGDYVGNATQNLMVIVMTTVQVLQDVPGVGSENKNIKTTELIGSQVQQA